MLEDTWPLVRSVVSVRYARVAAQLVDAGGKHYDLAQPLPCSKPLEFVCNQFIHSYIFAPLFDEHGCLESLVVASDWERSKGLYRVPILRVAEVFEMIGKDATTSATFTWDASLGDYRVEHV